MYRYFETIKIENGVVRHLEYHKARMLKTAFDNSIPESVIYLAINNVHCPLELTQGIVKCKLSYDISGFNVEYSEYVIRKIEKIKIVSCDIIDYCYKYCNRKIIEQLLLEKQDCDDILIVKNGKITDTSFSNIVLFDGKTYATPDKPLLKGTCRQRLLEGGRIEERCVKVQELNNYQKIFLINAMRGDELKEGLKISTSIIF